MLNLYMSRSFHIRKAHSFENNVSGLLTKINLLPVTNGRLCFQGHALN